MFFGTDAKLSGTSLDRLLAPIEKPALIVKRRLEQAGYEMADGIETLGAEEIGFLLRFVFKSVRLGGSQVSDGLYKRSK